MGTIYKNGIRYGGGSGSGSGVSDFDDLDNRPLEATALTSEEMADIISPIPVGGGGSGGNADMGNKILVKTNDSSFYGKTVTLTCDIDDVTAEGIFSATGEAYFSASPIVGHVEISSTNDNDETAQGSIDITTYGFYQTNISKEHTLINVSVMENSSAGHTFNVYDSGGDVYTTLTINASGNGSFYIYETGNYTIKGDVGTKHVYKEINVSALNTTQNVTLRQYNVYTYMVVESDATPYTRVEPYMSKFGCDNMNFTSAHMDYTNNRFDMGSWTGNEFFFPKPCMLNSDRTVAYYLNPNDYTKKEDGETDSDVANQNFDGNAMMEFPLIWIYRSQYGSRRCCIISDIRLTEDFEAMPYYTKENEVASYVYSAIYDGTVINGKMRSLSGVTSTRSTTRQQEESYAEANGSEWGCKTLGFWSMFIDLCYLITMSTDSKTVFGQGNNNGYNSHASGSDSNGILPNGYLNDKGLFFGYTATNLPVKIFGIENPYGSIWRNLRGLINANGTLKVKACKGTRDGSNVVDYNFDGANYITLTGISPTGTSGGYIRNIRYGKYGYVPYDANGSATTYETIGLWFNNSQVDFGVVGGNSAAGSLVGLGFCGLSDLASFSGWYIGGSLQTESSIIISE